MKLENHDIDDIDILAAIEKALDRAGREIAYNYYRWIIEETDKEYRSRKKNRRRRQKNDTQRLSR